jgi:hypothetical protein
MLSLRGKVVLSYGISPTALEDAGVGGFWGARFTTEDAQHFELGSRRSARLFLASAKMVAVRRRGSAAFVLGRPIPEKECSNEGLPANDVGLGEDRFEMILDGPFADPELEGDFLRAETASDRVNDGAFSLAQAEGLHHDVQQLDGAASRF